MKDLRSAGLRAERVKEEEEGGRGMGREQGRCLQELFCAHINRTVQFGRRNRLFP